MEIEAILNTRPLTYVDDDINSRRAISPSNFISNNVHTGFPDNHINHEYVRNLTQKELLYNWNVGQDVLNELWEIWSKEYLQELRSRKHLEMKRVNGEILREPKIGEVIIVEETRLPRGCWKLGRIEEKILSEADGLMKAAVIRTSTGNLLKRPLRMLYPLECSDYVMDDSKIVSNYKDQYEDMESKNNKREKQPKRNAAIHARQKIIDILA